MDLLIVADFIKKYSSEDEAKKALDVLKFFIAKREHNYDYYVIFLNSAGSFPWVTEGFDVADLETEESHYYPAFDEVLLNPIPHVSVSLRHDENPFVQSNPPMKMIFESINNYLWTNNRKINNIYIVHSSGCPKLQELKNSFLKYINDENIHLISVSNIKNNNIED